MALKFTATELAKPVTLTGLWISIDSAESTLPRHLVLILPILMFVCVIEWLLSRAKICWKFIQKNPAPTVSTPVCYCPMKVTTCCSIKMYLLISWPTAVSLCNQPPVDGRCMATVQHNPILTYWLARLQARCPQSMQVVLKFVCPWPTVTKWYRCHMVMCLPTEPWWLISCWVMGHCYKNKAWYSVK